MDMISRLSKRNSYRIFFQQLAFCCVLVLLAAQAHGGGDPRADKSKVKPLAFLKKELTKAKSDYIMVVAHRGYWHKAPENSMAGIEKAIEIGVDMVEVDIRKTKDGVLVLMHDETVDRTTNGKGKVADLTLAEIRGLKLKMNNGQQTEMKVPTFEEAMRYAKGKVLINVDKAEQLFAEVGEVLRKTGTMDIAVVKSGLTVDKIKPVMHHIKGSPFMAVISLDKNKEPFQKIEDYIGTYASKMMEISYQTENSNFFDGYHHKLLDRGVKIWMTPCASQWVAGHHDDRAVAGDEEGAWGWLLKRGATILLSNEPKALIEYLEKKGLRN